MIPHSLTISGFLSYRAPAEIDFTGFDLACIAGSNGAGKSSILDAVTWALFGQARQRGDAVLNAQSDAAAVTLVFEYEDNLYRVIRTKPRGKTGVLEFHIAQRNGNALTPDSLTWKPLSERTSRETQRRIEETLRLDYETFINAAFFLQGKADQFTQQSPGNRKRILASILGLEIWETYRQRAARRRKDTEGEIRALDGRLDEVNAELREEKERKARLAELQNQLAQMETARKTQEQRVEEIRQQMALLESQRKMVDTLTRQLEADRERMTDLELRLESRQAERGQHAEILARQTEIEEAYRALQEARKELKHWEEIAARFREHEKRRQGPLTTLEAARARLLQEAETLRERESDVGRQRSTLSDLQAKIADLQSQIASLETKIAERKSLEAELDDARTALANAKAENPRLKAEMEELKARIVQLEETGGAVCPLCEQPLSSGDRAALVARLETEGKAMGDKYRANAKLLDEAETLVNDLKSKISALESLDDDLQNARSELSRLTAQKEQLEAQIADWEREGALRLTEITRILEEETFAPEARAELAAVDAELQALGYDAAAHDAVRSTAADPVPEEDYRALESAQAALKPLDDEIANLQAQISSLRSSIAEQEADLQKIAAAYDEAKAAMPDLGQAQRELLNIRERENALRREVGAAEQKVAVLGDLRARRKSLEAEREELARRAAQFKQLEKAFGKDGVPALLIEQALPQIETKANDILSRLTDGGMSVRFQTQRELKTRDDLKETLDITISDGAGTRDYEMFSGGEAFRVNFAIRLALSEILAQRSGARLQTLVIDEGFGSQDALGRQRLIEAINAVRKDFAKILVITHIDALKDAFPTRIEVEKTPRGSVVSVVTA